MAAAPLPDPLPVEPRGPLDAQVAVPGSKSLSNRALVAAALARGESRLEGLLESDDIAVMRHALAALGVEVRPAPGAGDTWLVAGGEGGLRVPPGPLDAGASGTAARFLTAVAALAPGPVVVDGTRRLRERPVQDVVDALGALGVPAQAQGPGGGAPVWVQGGGLAGGHAPVDARRSSQTLSALLLVAPYARRDVQLELVEGRLVSRSYVELTLQVMEAFGVAVRRPEPAVFAVAAGQGYRGRTYRIEPDASTAAYFFCAAAIAGGRVRVPGLGAASAQADLGLLEVLQAMGCEVRREDAGGVEVRGPGAPGLAGVDVDMNAMPDAVLALAVTAAFARGPTRIRRVGHLRIKESDRLAGLEAELRKLGCGARVEGEDLVVAPGPLHGATVETYDDHRMAMAFALVGLRVPGVRIRDPGCVSKSWPSYFDALARL